MWVLIAATAKTPQQITSEKFLPAAWAVRNFSPLLSRTKNTIVVSFTAFSQRKLLLLLAGPLRLHKELCAGACTPRLCLALQNLSHRKTEIAVRCEITFSNFPGEGLFCFRALAKTKKKQQFSGIKMCCVTYQIKKKLVNQIFLAIFLRTKPSLNVGTNTDLKVNF